MWDDYAAAKAMVLEAGLQPQIFVLNDMIELFPEAAVGVTLHPDKLNFWLPRREKAGFPKPQQVWAHRSHRLVDRRTTDYGGSVGLLGLKVAHQDFGNIRCILCGVPMDAKYGHVVRKKPWQDVRNFIGKFLKHVPEFKDFTRSMGGWTAQQFGKPDVAWLQSALTEGDRACLSSAGSLSVSL